MTGSRKKLLLVDDEAIIAAAESQALRRRGYEVVTALRGETAIEMASDPDLDLVLMDIDLGRGAMDGTETASRILMLKDLPIVFLSSHTEPEIVERTETITSYGYVVKNSGDTVLDASIKMAFKLHEAKREVMDRRQEVERAIRETELREQRLRHINRVLLSIRNINQIITKDPERGDLLKKTCQFLVDASGYYRAWIVMLEDGKPIGPLAFSAVEESGIPEMALGLHSGRLTACMEKALAKPGIEITADPDTACLGCALACTHVDGLSGEAAIAGMSSRIEHGGKIYGCLCVSLPRHYAQDPDEHVLFQEIVDDLGYALHKQEIEIERGKTEEVLHDSEENLRATLNSIGDAVISTDEGGKVVRMNPVAEALTGWSLAEARGRPLPEVFRIVRADTGEEAPNPAEKVLSSGGVVGMANHTVLVSKDGTRRQIADSGAPIRASGGEISGVVLVFRDVSEEYRIREALRRNEDRLRKILLAANDGSWDWDLVTNVVDFDRRYYEMAGYAADEFPHTLSAFQERIHPEDVGAVMDTAARHLRGELDRFEVEFRFAKKGGGWIWILGRGVIVERDGTGAPLRFVGTHTDISQRKAIEKNLRTERRRLADVLAGTNVGSWEWNVQTGNLTLNERWAEMIGYTLDEISPTTLDTWIRFVHPEDLASSNELLERHFRGETAFYECEARMRHRDGRWIWVLDRGRVASRTQDGRPLIVSGTHQDITERKRAETLLKETLHEKENLLRELQHRMKNSFGLIISMLSLKAGATRSEETREALDAISARVRALLELYSMLYQAGSFQDVRLDEYCAKVVDSLRFLAEGVRIQTALEEMGAPIREAANVGLIVTELVTNALKHAYSRDGEGTIRVRLSGKDGHIELRVSNDGRPLPADFDISASGGLGLQLVKAMAEQHGGGMTMESGSETAFTVDLLMRKAAT